MSRTSVRLSVRRQGKALGAVVLAVAALAVLGFAAYKLLFNRPGEAAAAFLAADADVVVTLDTDPSQRQIATFKTIVDALDREGIAQKLDETITGFLNGIPVGREIRPHLKRSFAMGLWMKDGSASESATLCAVDDPAAVEASLKRHGESKDGHIFALTGTPQKLSASVVEGYLAISNSESALARIEKVRRGDEPSVTAVPEYRDARQALPEDANLMVFLSPRVFEQLQKATGGVSGSSAMKSTQWMAYSATVIPEGIAFDYQCPTDAKKMAALQRLGTIAEFDLEALKRLPEGAYGVAGYSQIGRYWSVLQESLEESPEFRKEFESGMSSFEKSTGLSVAQDIVPALNGEQILAIYPGLSGKPEDVDGVLVLTDANGANPAGLAAKVRELLVRKAAEEHVELRFEESQIGEYPVWEVDADGQKHLLDGAAKANPLSGIAPAPSEMPPMPPELANDPEMKKFYEDYERKRKEQIQGQNQPPAFLKNKTAVYAQVGNAVVMASSREMLQRALEAEAAGRSLANDPAIAAMKPHVIPGSQGVLFVNLHRIMKALEPSISKGMEGGPVRPADLLGLFGDGLVGLVASGRYDGKVASGRLLLPLDFDRGIAMIGSSMQAADSRRDMGPSDSVFTK